MFFKLFANGFVKEYVGYYFAYFQIISFSMHGLFKQVLAFQWLKPGFCVNIKFVRENPCSHALDETGITLVLFIVTSKLMEDFCW